MNLALRKGSMPILWVVGLILLFSFSAWAQCDNGDFTIDQSAFDLSSNPTTQNITTCTSGSLDVDLDVTPGSGHIVNNSSGPLLLDQYGIGSIATVVTYTFSSPVQIQNMNIGDIDGSSHYDDRVEVSVSGANVNVISTSSQVEIVSGNGTPTVIVRNNGGTANTNGNAVFKTDGPISSMTITYTDENTTNGNRFVFIEDITTCCPKNCSAGDDEPVLVDVTNFSSNTYTIPCGSAVADLTEMSASNAPEGTILTYHSGTPATDMNKVAPVTTLGTGTYYVAFFDPGDKCYSKETQAINVVKEDPCVNDCATPITVSSCSDNNGANATSSCTTLENADQILFFNWSGTLTDGQEATINANGVTYTATVSNYEHTWNGTERNLVAADLDSELWVGTKMKYMYSDGDNTKNEGWYIDANEDTGLHRWTVTITAIQDATGASFPVNIIGFDMESSNNNQGETVVLQSLDGGNWTKLEDYQPSCAGTTNHGLGNGGPGIITGIGTTTITYTDTENNGGNSYWISEGANTINLEITTGQGALASRQGAALALYLDCDEDNDGIPDKYETSITGVVKDVDGNLLAGAEVELFDSEDNSLGTVTTGADGEYTFTNVPQGKGFRLVETDPDGYESDSDSEGTNDNVINDIETNYGYISCYTEFIDKELGAVSGNLFNDPDAGNVNNSSGSANAVPSGLFANLLDENGVVVATAPIASDGSYSFANVPEGNYTISAGTKEGTIGNAAPSDQGWPSEWSNTGDYNGAENSGNSNTTPNLSESFAVSSGQTTEDVNFGMQKKPTAVDNTLSMQNNPGGTTNVNIPLSNFDGDDSDGGTVNSMTITSFPNDVTSITVNGVVYTSSNFPSGGISIPTDSNGVPTQTIEIDPVDGLVDVEIPYTVTDNAGATSDGNTVTVSFSMLPVTLVYFNGVSKNGKVFLNWETATELNNDYFKVERSLDGIRFNGIGKVKGSGTTIEAQQYDYIDSDVSNLEKVYYRLKQVDFDGAFEYSPLVAVRLAGEEANVFVYPNPVRENLSIKVVGYTDYSIELFDLSGMKLLVTKSAFIDMTRFKSGTYIINVLDSNQKIIYSSRITKID